MWIITTIPWTVVIGAIAFGFGAIVTGIQLLGWLWGWTCSLIPTVVWGIVTLILIIISIIFAITLLVRKRAPLKNKPLSFFSKFSTILRGLAITLFMPLTSWMFVEFNVVVGHHESYPFSGWIWGYSTLCTIVLGGGLIVISSILEIVRTKLDGNEFGRKVAAVTNIFISLLLTACSVFICYLALKNGISQRITYCEENYKAKETYVLKGDAMLYYDAGGIMRLFHGGIAKDEKVHLTGDEEIRDENIYVEIYSKNYWGYVQKDLLKKK